ncbi:MAG: hypothetical protein RR101_15405 [Burkholderiaceae bacterium]
MARASSTSLWALELELPLLDRGARQRRVDRLEGPAYGGSGRLVGHRLKLADQRLGIARRHCATAALLVDTRTLDTMIEARQVAYAAFLLTAD